MPPPGVGLGGGPRILNTFTSMRVLLLALLAFACRRAPEVPLQVQGTVTAVGLGQPVRDAEVTVEWPPGLGGGSAVAKTDRAGRYVVRKTIRSTTAECSGLVLTVRKAGYASAYSNRDSSLASCADSVLTIDFKLFPLQQ